jgi:hypothetical protein
MVAEMVPEKELQPKAFSLMPLVWSIGSIFGPAFGGFFANPARQFPSLFGNNAFLTAYPFALPNILGSIIFMISFTTGLLFLKETLASKRDERDWGLALGERLTQSFAGRTRRITRRYSFQDDESTAPLLAAEVTRKGKSSPSIKTEKNTPIPMSAVFSRQSVINLVAYTFLALHSVAYDQILPVFLNYPRDEHDPASFHLPFRFTGGFGMTSGSIGTIFTMYGIVCGLVQFLIFPPLCTHFGVLRCFRACSITFPVVYLLTPFTTLVEDETTRLACLLCVMVIKAFCVIIGFPCTTILLTNSATSLSILGTLNGFATTFSALGRACGPAMAGAAFSWGVKHGVIAMPWWLLAVISAVGAIPAWWIVEGDGPSGGGGSSSSSAASNTPADLNDDEATLTNNSHASGTSDETTPASRSRAVASADGEHVQHGDNNAMIQDFNGQEFLPLVGSMRSASGMDYAVKTRQASSSKKGNGSDANYGSFN